MKICKLCNKPIEPGQPVIELVGGLFDPEDPDFFVQDSDVFPEVHAHADEVLAKLNLPVA